MTSAATSNAAQTIHRDRRIPATPRPSESAVVCDRSVEMTIQQKVAMPISFCADGLLHSAIKISAKTIVTSSRSRVQSLFSRLEESDSRDRETVSGTNFDQP